MHIGSITPACEALAERGYERIKPYIKPFVWLVVLYAIGLGALIRANVYYIDDIQRVSNGVRGWSVFSRYLSDYASALVHANRYLSDMSPFTQWLAVLFMALGGMIFFVALTEKQNPSLMDVIALVPFGLSPYFLQCYSYKFDAPYMALSVLAMVFPLAFRKQKPWFYAPITIFCTLVMCTTYQASSGIFPMVVLFVCLQDWQRGKSLGKVMSFAGLSALYYGIGTGLFRVGMMRDTQSYASSEMLGFSDLWSGAVGNFQKYVGHIGAEFRDEWLILIALLALLYLWLMVRKSQQNKLATLILTLCAIFLGFVFSYGGYLFLQKPLYSPRALYGFGVFIAVLTVNLSATKRAYLSKLVCVGLCYAFFAFACSYGNTLAIQKQYTDFTTQSIASELSSLYADVKPQDVEVVLDAKPVQAPIIASMPDDYALIKRLTGVTYSGGSFFGQYHLKSYLGNDQFRFREVTNEADYALPVLVNTLQYTIRGDEQTALVQIKR